MTTIAIGVPLMSADLSRLPEWSVQENSENLQILGSGRGTPSPTVYRSNLNWDPGLTWDPRILGRRQAPAVTGGRPCRPGRHQCPGCLKHPGPQGARARREFAEESVGNLRVPWVARFPGFLDSLGSSVPWVAINGSNLGQQWPAMASHCHCRPWAAMAGHGLP